MEIQAHRSDNVRSKVSTQDSKYSGKMIKDEAENSKNILQSHCTLGISCHVPAFKWTVTTKAF